MNSDDDWFVDVYVKHGDLLFDLLTVPKSVYKETPKHIGFIDGIIRSFLKNAKTVLDIPCGDGRISAGLTEKGYDVTGVDISPKYIEKARSKAPMSGKFIVGDMRNVELDEKFDVVLNWYGSFGYFDEETNFKVLSHFSDFLNDGGLLILDLRNRDYLIHKNYVLMYEWKPEIVVRENDKLFFLRYSFDPKTSVLTLRVKNDGKEFHYRMRLYSLHEIIKIIDKIGLEIIRIYGDYNGSSYSLYSHRLVIVAKK